MLYLNIYDPYLFCQIIIKYIKDKLSILNNSFHKYIDYLKKRRIDRIRILDDILSETTLIKLIDQSNIKKTFKNKERSRICLRVIAIALIICPDYESLKNNLISLTGLSERSIRQQINNYIPFLKQLNPKIDINIWLPVEKKISYQDCINLAKIKSIQLITTEKDYNSIMKIRKKVPSETKIKWKCKEEHLWNASYKSVKNSKYGCPYCSGNLPISYQDCIDLAKGRGIKLLTTNYDFNQLNKNRSEIPSKLKLKWRCKEDHEWCATYNNIRQHKSGCPYCYGNIPISYQNCKDLADNRGIELLTTKTEFNKLMKIKKCTPSKLKLRWKCKERHEWSATYNNIKHLETKCPCCFGNLPISYQDCIDLARGRGFQFAATEMEFNKLMKNRDKTPTKLKLRWKCQKNHKWNATYSDIKQGRGCPKCAEGWYEKVCRWYVEKIFGVKFHKIKLNKIIQSYNGQMHLDGFAIKSISGLQTKLAFEFNGIQHDKFPNFFHKTYNKFLEQRKWDQEKIKLCEMNGIVLIIFPQRIDMRMNHPEIIQNYIIQEFEKKTGIKLLEVRQYNHLTEWSNRKELDDYL